jgi:hypothetical protein
VALNADFQMITALLVGLNEEVGDGLQLLVWEAVEVT